ncbi:hypothetical protein Tco_0995085 [Tanacetum coccineum]
MGPSPIVISKGISPKGHDCSLEKPTREVFESTRRDLIDGFSFKKQCSYITSHELPPSRSKSSPLSLCKWMKGLWRDVQPDFVFSNHERSQRFVVLRGGLGFASPRNYLGPLSHHKNQYGKAFLIRLKEDNPRSSEQKVLQSMQNLRRVLQGLGIQYIPSLISGGAPNRGIAYLGLEKEIRSFSIDKVHRGRHKSSRNMKTTRSSGGKHGSSYRKVGRVVLRLFDLVRTGLIVAEGLDRDGERGFGHLTFALVSLKAHREGVGLRVADSHTGNHPEGGFTSLESIRRLLVVTGRRSHSGFEGETFKPERRVLYQYPEPRL